MYVLRRKISRKTQQIICSIEKEAGALSCVGLFFVVLLVLGVYVCKLGRYASLLRLYRPSILYVLLFLTLVWTARLLFLPIPSKFSLFSAFQRFSLDGMLALTLSTVQISLHLLAILYSFSLRLQ